MAGQQKIITHPPLSHFPLSPVKSVGALALILGIGALQSSTMTDTARAAQLFATIAIVTYLGLFAGYHDSDSMKNKTVVATAWFCLIAAAIFQIYSLTLSLIWQS